MTTSHRRLLFDIDRLLIAAVVLKAGVLIRKLALTSRFGFLIVLPAELLIAQQPRTTNYCSASAHLPRARCISAIDWAAALAPQFAIERLVLETDNNKFWFVRVKHEHCDDWDKARRRIVGARRSLILILTHYI